MTKLILMNQARLGQLGECLIGGPLVPEHKLGDTRFRFDFYFPNPRVALEFEGPEHYSKVDHIDRDQRKLETATREGISIIRWPYYLQMSREVTAALFGTHFSDVGYAKAMQGIFGGLSKSAIPPSGCYKTTETPANFPRRGCDRLLAELGAMPVAVQREVCHSLLDYSMRCGAGKSWLVLPEHDPRIADFIALVCSRN